MRLSDLYDAKVRTKDGKKLGRVHEIHVKAGEVTHLCVGTRSLVERLTGGKVGRRIAWEDVLEARKSGIVVRD